ncbi:MAG TPA: hypothetical protein VMP11_08315 [Verrucomicrobiae bacterium]|nr:hypothetical protein [Verrucomicrobiae bacterium]
MKYYLVSWVQSGLVSTKTTDGRELVPIFKKQQLATLYMMLVGRGGPSCVVEVEKNNDGEVIGMVCEGMSPGELRHVEALLLIFA